MAKYANLDNHVVTITTCADEYRRLIGIGRSAEQAIDRTLAGLVIEFRRTTKHGKPPKSGLCIALGVVASWWVDIYAERELPEILR